MYNILIHMGLPKTATTSLQNNFFMQLHEEKKINFLGRSCLPFQKGYFNPFYEILDKLNHDLTPEAELELRNKFFSMLRGDKINVISEESLTVTYNQKHDLIYRNLKIITKGCDVEVLLCLRNPMEFTYTYYVEAYRWHYYSVKGKDNIEGFVSDLCVNHSSTEYDSLFFGRLLEKISNNFGNVNLYLFEDFVRDKEAFIELLSRLMVLDVEDVNFVMNLDKENSRKVGGEGKVSESITLNQRLSILIKGLFSEKAISNLKNMAVVRVLYMMLLGVLSKIRFKKSIVHPFLTESQINRLSRFLLIDVEEFSNKYGLDSDKLIEYDYGLGKEKGFKYYKS